MTNTTEFKTLETKFNAAEEVLISMKELTVDPEFQMREKMDHSVIDDYVEVLEDLPPVHVFEAENRLILVDGFHRFFANEKVEAEDIRAKVVKGTREDAMKYAMVANFAHLKGGSKPNSDDQKKAIQNLCVLLRESFGYNAMSVIPALKNIGVTSSQSWMEKCSAGIRAEITSQRNAKIAEMLEEGHARKDIAAAVGMSATGLSSYLKKQEGLEALRKADSTENVADEDATPPFADETLDAEDIPFDEDDLDDSPVVNPADASRKALEQFNSQLEESNTKAQAASSTPIVLNDGNSITRDQSPMDAVADAFAGMVEAWQTHGKEAFDKFLKLDDESAEECRQEFLQIMRYAVLRIE